MNNKPMCERSVDTDIIIKHLKDKPIETKVSYEELTALTKRPKIKLAGILRTAINALWAEGQHWLVVRSEGIERVSSEDALARPLSRQMRIKKQANGGKRDLRAIDYQNLSGTAKMQFNALGTIHFLVSRVVAPRFQDKLLAAVAETQRKLSMEEAAERLLGRRKA